VTATALNYRRANASLFLDGEYVSLESQGNKKDHVCAFARIYQDQAVVVVVPRLVAGLMPEAERLPLGSDVWEDTLVTVPSWKQGSPYRNMLTGEVLRSSEAAGSQVLNVAEILSDCPVALLERIA